MGKLTATIIEEVPTQIINRHTDIQTMYGSLYPDHFE